MRTVRKTHSRRYVRPARSPIIRFLAASMLAIGLLLSGCQKDADISNVVNKGITTPDVELNPLAPLIDVQESSHNDGTSITLGGSHTITFVNSTYSRGKTTFNYSVSGSGSFHFEVELPECAGTPSSVSPNGASIDSDGLNPTVEWHPPYNACQSSCAYSITYNGNVKEGIVEVSIKVGSNFYVGELPGACARVFDIGGMLFADANSNGAPDGEAGIFDKEVLLLDAYGEVASDQSDINGNYLFECIPQGDYTVMVVTADVVGDTDNEYIQATTSTEQDITIGPDQLDVNFGFEPKVDKMTNDMKFGDLETDGRSANYWKTQASKALSGRPDDFTASEFNDLIDDINDFALSNPFSLSNLQHVKDLLSKPTKTDAEKLQRELLAAELNHFAEFGFIDTDEQLQEVMLIWVEGVLAGALGGSASSLQTKTVSAAAVSSGTLSSATSMTRTFNSGGGGGDH